MRIEHLSSYLNLNSSPQPTHHKGKIRHNAGKEHTSVSQNAIKNTDLNRPAKSVNFSGSVGIDTQKIVNAALSELSQNGRLAAKFKQAPKWAGNFLDSEGVKKALKLVNNNEALFENIITLGLAGLLKPICVLLMPGTEEKDKQANATKNFVAAVTGFILTTVLLTPISKGVKKVTANSDALAKYVKDPDYIKLISEDWEDVVIAIDKNGKEIMGGTQADAFKTFYKKIADLAISPTKAAITIGFMPYLLNFLFKNKNERKEAAKKAAIQEKLKLNNQTIKINQSEQIFKQFKGGAITCR